MVLSIYYFIFRTCIYFFKKIKIKNTYIYIQKAYSTWGSKAVAQPSTSQARRGLTSVIGREPVLSAWYGRKPKALCLNSHLYAILFYFILFIYFILFNMKKIDIHDHSIHVVFLFLFFLL